jgi:hypothetical protein
MSGRGASREGGLPTRHDNPYEARYGNNWKSELKKATQMQAYVCITDMIEHIVQESEAVMAGTSHEEDWMFYHDALSLMTAADSMEWMREKDYLRRWIFQKLICIPMTSV